MGLFLGALDNPLMQEEMTAKQQFVYTAKQMGRRSWGSAKAFAVMGFVFSAAECVVEKVSILRHVQHSRLFFPSQYVPVILWDLILYSCV